MKHKLGQLFFIGIEGTSLSSFEEKFIVENNIGGVTLFGRNLESPEQIHDLCAHLDGLKHRMPEKTPLVIGIDMEGGRVHRLKPPFTQWPSLKKLGDIGSTSAAFKFAQNMGQELKAIGINLDYAPCADIFTNPKNEIIGDRAVSSDPEEVAKMVSALVRGYIKSDIIPCAKHFPGHGDTLLDSHEDLPVESTTLEELKNRELIPFKKAFRARLDMVMTAHIKFENIDPDWPVTLSKIFIQDLLRTEYRFKNIVITDDLDMKALRNNYDIDVIAARALEVGCDILLYCNEPDSPPIGIAACLKALKDGVVPEAQVMESYEKVIALKKRFLSQSGPISFEAAKEVIGHPKHFELAEAINAGSIPQELLEMS